MELPSIIPYAKDDGGAGLGEGMALQGYDLPCLSMPISSREHMKARASSSFTHWSLSSRLHHQHARTRLVQVE